MPKARTARKPSRRGPKRSKVRRPRTSGLPLGFVEVDVGGSTLLGAVSDLPTFLGTAGALTRAQRRRIVQQALILFGDYYCHLPLKEAMHAVDPLQRLRLLDLRISRTKTADLEPELEFHREVLEIFNSLRDLHTNYTLPSPFADHIAFLPFLVEAYVEDGETHFLVTNVFGGVNDPDFVAEVEIHHWNGAPMEKAVWAQAHRTGGSNLDARFARGLESMTIRPLATDLPPDEEWVVVGYRTASGQEREVRFDWSVFSPDPIDGGVDPDSGSAAAARLLGIDLTTDLVRQAKRLVFKPDVAKRARQLAKRKRTAAAEAAMGLDSFLPDIFEARSVPTANGAFGYVRIRTFSVDDDAAFLDEFVRLVDQLPQNGLILDVRGNGGGLIPAAERLLQVLTPNDVEPETFQFISSPRTLDLVGDWDDLEVWEPSLVRAVRTGADYSRGFPITTATEANDIGQVYHGPVVLIIDALCYSATDMFAAGFQDNGVGKVLGTAGHTGAGGANVWTHALLRDLTGGSGSPLEPLPKGAGMRVSIRRTLRVGPRAGVPIEDLGVEPDELHEMTRDDLTDHNADLIEHAGEILAAQWVYDLEVDVTGGTATTLDLAITTTNLDRVDVYINGRPSGSQDVSDGTTAVTIESDDPIPWAIEVRGFDSGELKSTYELEA